MEETIIKITPDKEKARSILKMIDTTLKMIGSLDVNRFSSNITKEYYEVIRELITVVLLLDGYKTYGEGAHKKLIDYLNINYKSFNESEILLIDDLRIIRNKIAYDGFFVQKDYLDRKINNINNIIKKLKEIIKKRFV